MRMEAQPEALASAGSTQSGIAAQLEELSGRRRRSSPDGTRGEKLAWDLDGNGKISADEREITERELYDATLGPE